MNTYKKILTELFNQPSVPCNATHCVQDLLGNKNILLYGAGSGFATFSVFVLRKYGLKAYAVLDQKFKGGDTYFTIPAFNSRQYRPTTEEKETSVVVITIGKAEYHEEIFHCLHSLGFKNIILANDIYEYHLHYSSMEIERKGFHFFLENREKIMSAINLFSDNLSGEVFSQFIQTHLFRKPLPIPHHLLEEQYFPRDIQLSKGYSRFINCGAYNGDTVKQLNKLFGKIDAAVCFEPDPESFESLTRYLSDHNEEIANSITSFPCGVFSHETQLHFSGGDKSNSAIAAEGDLLIQCVAMDHVIPNFNPTFISMDVEGSELEALKGAENLIRKSRPGLAICVYHLPNHIWDIPLYLNGLNLGYKFYLRNYTSFIAETVLYATIV